MGPGYDRRCSAAEYTGLSSVPVPNVGIQTGCLLGCTLKQGAAVKQVTGKYGQPARGPSAYAGVLLTVGRARGRIENRSWANLKGGLLVNLD